MTKKLFGAMKTSVFMKIFSFVALILIILGGISGYLVYLHRVQPNLDVSTLTRSASDNTGRKLTNRLIIVMIDGLRETIAFDPEVMPYMNQLKEQGVYGFGVTPPITLTALGQLTFGTGMTPSMARTIQNFDAEPHEDESVFQFMKESGLKIAIVADSTWCQLYGKYAEFTLGYPDAGLYSDDIGHLTVHDIEIIETATEKIKDPSYDVIVIHIDGVDKQGHKHTARKFDSEGNLSPYSKASLQTDEVLSRLVPLAGDQTTWIITAEHGQTEGGAHGGGEEEARISPFVAVGPGFVPRSGILGEENPKWFEFEYTSWAATISVLFGLPVPRIAETPAIMEMLNITEQEKAAAAVRHQHSRQRFIEGFLDVTGSGVQLNKNLLNRSGLALKKGDYKEARQLAFENIDYLNSVERNDVHNRKPFRVFGIVVLLLLIGGLIMLLSAYTDKELSVGPGQAALAVLILGIVLVPALIEDYWLYAPVKFFGQALDNPLNLIIRLSVISGVVAVSWFGVRFLRSRLPKLDLTPPMMWVLFSVAVVTLCQPILKWPYGPLRETYQVLTVASVLILAFMVIKTRRDLVKPLAIILLSLTAMYVLGHSFEGIQKSSSTLFTIIVANTLVVVFVLRTVIKLFVRGSELAGQVVSGKFSLALEKWGITAVYLTRAAGVMLLVLTGLAIASHATENHLFSRIFSVLFLVSIPLLGIASKHPEMRRDILFALSFALYRLLTTDLQIFVLVPVAILLLVVSGIRKDVKWYDMPVMILVLLVFQISVFKEMGYGYSFSSMDVTVAFVLDRGEVRVGWAIFLIAIQHLTPWLLYMATLSYNRWLNEDPWGQKQILWALLLIFAIQCWGAYFPFEYRIGSYWFTLHAIPFYMFATGNAILVTIAFWLSTSKTLVTSEASANPDYN